MMKKKKIYLINYKDDYSIEELINSNIDSFFKLIKYSLHTNKNIKPSFDFLNIGCSCFNATNYNNEVLFGRNFDYKESDPVIIWTSPSNGYKSVSITDINMLLFLNKMHKGFWIKRFKLAPFMPMDGINEKGLSIGILHIRAKQTKQNTNKKVILTTTAMRLLLDKAANVDEAIELLKKYDMVDMVNDGTYHFIISDATNKSVVVEYVDNEMIITPQTIYENENKSLCVTNFYLNDKGDNSFSNGQDRYKLMKEYLSNQKGKLEDLESLKLLNKLHKRCHHPKLPCYVATIYSALYNLNNLSFLFCSHMDYSKVYKIDLFKPGKYELLSADALIDDYKPFKD